MPIYMTQFAYTPEAWAALVRRPEDRSKVLDQLLHQFGGKLISFYYAFSEYDGIAIYEAPDETAAAGALLAVFGPGHNKAIKTTQLLSVDQALEAMRRAAGVRYQPPTISEDNWRPYSD